MDVIEHISVSMATNAIMKGRLRNTFSLLAVDMVNLPGDDSVIQVTSDNTVNLMLTSLGNWNAVCVFLRVLTQQRLIERARSAELEGSTR